MQANGWRSNEWQSNRYACGRRNRIARPIMKAVSPREAVLRQCKTYEQAYEKTCGKAVLHEEVHGVTGFPE